MEEVRDLRRVLSDVGKPAVFLLCSLSLALVGTFRNFGYDLNGADGVRGIYPDVADGWGAWHWLAQLGLNFDLYFFVLSLLLSVGIMTLAFRAGRGDGSFPVSLTLAIYLIFWFLFAQTRYGTAVVFVCLAVAANSIWLFAISVAVGFFFHRAIAGGALLVAAWLILRNRKWGLILAAVLSCMLAYIIFSQADKILLLTAYSNYKGLELNAPANTPLKYYFDIAILVLWKCFNRKAPHDLLVLAVLFLPTSYYIVFAGRAHEFYSTIFLSCLLTSPAPRLVKYAILAEYLFDVGMLAFGSGAFF